MSSKESLLTLIEKAKDEVCQLTAGVESGSPQDKRLDSIYKLLERAEREVGYLS